MSFEKRCAQERVVWFLIKRASKQQRSAVRVLCFLSPQVEVDWDKIRAKIEVELSRERERGANAKSSTASRR